MEPKLKIRIKHKPLTLDEVKEMRIIVVQNVRGIKATIHHYTSMVNGLSESKKDEKARREMYKRMIRKAQEKLEEEEFWFKKYTATINKHTSTAQAC
jgi:hypothetical protein